MARSTVKHYFITLFVCLVLDAIWLGMIAQQPADLGLRRRIVPADEEGVVAAGQHGCCNGPLQARIRRGQAEVGQRAQRVERMVRVVVAQDRPAMSRPGGPATCLAARDPYLPPMPLAAPPRIRKCPFAPTLLHTLAIAEQ